MTIDLVNKRLKITDNTVYADFGETLNTLIAFGTVSGPVGVIAERNTMAQKLIALAFGQTESEWFNTPLSTSTGQPLLGNYSVVYRVGKGINFSLAVVSSGVIAVIGTWVGPTGIEVGDFVQVYSPEGSAGVYEVLTVYQVEGDPNTYFTINEDLADGAISFLVMKDYEYVTKNFVICHDTPAPEINIKITHSCEAASFKSSDVTEYGGIVLSSRTHRISLPRYTNGAAVGPDFVSNNLSTNKTIILQQLWTGGYTVSISVAGTNQVSEELIYLFAATSQRNYIVTCGTRAWMARQCIAELLGFYKKFCSQDSSRNPYQCALTQINAHYVLMKMYEQTSSVDQATQEANKIIEIANAYGCNCTMYNGDSGPVEIVAGSFGSIDDSLPWEATGDMLFYNDAAADRLPIGANFAVLTVVDGVPTWQSVTTAPGDLAIGGVGGQLGRLPLGTLHHVLTVGASGPEYKKPQGDNFYLNDAQLIGTGVPAINLPAGYINEDGEGVMHSFVFRTTTAQTITARLGTIDYQVSSSLSTGTYNVRAYVVKDGLNWKVVLETASTLGQQQIAVASFVASGPIAFDQPLEFTVFTNVPESSGINVVESRYVRKKLSV